MEDKKLTPGGYRLNAPTAVLLAIHNLQEEKKGKEAFLHRHFALSPEIDDFPVVFTDEEKSYLKGSPFLGQLDWEMEAIKYDYDLIVKEIPEFGQQFTLRDFTRAKMLVTSRYFGVWKGDDHVSIQVPLADMFNAQNPKNSWWYYDSSEKGFAVDAVRDIKKGEEIFYTYGRKCNSQFFLYYAYIEQDNDEHNTFQMKIEMDPEAENFEMKKDVFFLDQTQPQVNREFLIKTNLTSEAAENMLAWARFVVYDGEDLSDLYDLVESSREARIQKLRNEGESQDKIDKLKDSINIDQGISIENEAQVWKLIKKHAETALSKYETTIE